MSDAELIRKLATIAEGLSYQSECRPRPSRSREALRAAVADLHDAMRHIERESGEHIANDRRIV